mmetsp:Transcript_23155/g.74492  ORF Transcript_23155/g.74492 Transcript_23155/m.74492 type:complete len:261 (-) Transcript_23155:247-1029(-)
MAVSEARRCLTSACSRSNMRGSTWNWREKRPNAGCAPHATASSCERVGNRTPLTVSTCRAGSANTCTSSSLTPSMATRSSNPRSSCFTVCCGRHVGRRLGGTYTRSSAAGSPPSDVLLSQSSAQSVAEVTQGAQSTSSPAPPHSASDPCGCELHATVTSSCRSRPSSSSSSSPSLSSSTSIAPPSCPLSSSSGAASASDASAHFSNADATPCRLSASTSKSWIVRTTDLRACRTSSRPSARIPSHSSSFLVNPSHMPATR